MAFTLAYCLYLAQYAIALPRTYLHRRRRAERLENGRVLDREIRALGYQCSYSTVVQYVRPRRRCRQPEATMRFETEPGERAQVHWGNLSYIGAGGKKRRVWVFVMTMACPCAPSPGNSASLATQCANTPTPRDRPPRSSVPRSEPSCWGYANPNALPNNRPNVFAFHLIVQNRWTTINAGPITSNIDNLILPHSVAGVGPSAPPMLRLIRRRQWATRPLPC